jgi:hypothetical protein
MLFHVKHAASDKRRMLFHVKHSVLEQKTLVSETRNALQASNAVLKHGMLFHRASSVPEHARSVPSGE